MTNAEDPLSTSGHAMSDDALAYEIADGTGRLLLEAQRQSLLRARVLGEAGDALAHQWIVHALREFRPDDGVLSEEGDTDTERLQRDRVWIVDPLDGTREFAERRTDWAVHVALVVDGRPSACAVALPPMGVTLSTASVAARPRSEGSLRIAVSRSRPAREAQAVQGQLGADLVPMGSAGRKVAAVLRGEVDAYLHSGGQYEWDSAAPVGVASAAGLHASRIDGSPLAYNQPDPLLADLLVCRSEIAEELLAAVACCGAAADVDG